MHGWMEGMKIKTPAFPLPWTEEFVLMDAMDHSPCPSAKSPQKQKRDEIETFHCQFSPYFGIVGDINVVAISILSR